MDNQLKIFRAWLDKAGLDEKPHQISGLEFCLNREKTNKHGNPRGGIIADEMGLGKTILMLGTFVCEKATDGGIGLPTLVVLPKALLHQWMKIFKNFLNYSPLLYHGPNVKNITEDMLKKASVVITTYGMVSSGGPGRPSITPNANKSPLKKIKWNRVIMDEAHHIRNTKSGSFKGALSLDRNITWIVTGTPIQNETEDLDALFQMLGLDKSYYETVSVTRETIKKYVLRRTKKSVGIKLPPLNVETITVPWASLAERNLAAQIHSRTKFSKITFDNVDFVIDEMTKGTLASIIRSRQVCINPQLIKTALKTLQKKQIVGKDINLNHILTNSKTQAIVDQIISNMASGTRKIVFCHYRGEIDLLKNALENNNIPCSTFDGRTGSRQREFITDYAISKVEFSLVCKKWRNLADHIFPIVNQFVAPTVLIMQIKSACEGLNLQHFQEIYFSSPHWNPAVEDQAVARAHRINQKGKVNVYKFIMEDFVIEEHEMVQQDKMDNPDDRDDIEDLGVSITLDKYCQHVQNIKRETMKLITDHETPNVRNKKIKMKVKVKGRVKNANAKTAGSKAEKCKEPCCICLHEMDNSSEKKIMALPCGHIFHEDCINQWISTKPTCPVCNYEIKL